MKKIFIIILHYKGRSLTRSCLESLKKIKKNNFQVETIVVVNNPAENLSVLSQSYPKVTFLKPGKNLGFAGGNNFGIKHALKNDADFVFLLNNDTKVKPDFLVQLIKVAENRPDAGLFAPKIYFAPGFEFHKERYTKADQGKVIWSAGGSIDWANIATPHRGVDEIDEGQYDQVEAVDFASFCAILIGKQVFEKIGFLAERYFLYYEDADFIIRAKRAGFKILFVPDSVVWHKVSGSSEIGGRLHDYFMVRNQLLFGLKYAARRAKLALLKQSLRFLLFGRPWQRKGVIDFYLGRFGKGSFASF